MHSYFITPADLTQGCFAERGPVEYTIYTILILRGNFMKSSVRMMARASLMTALICLLSPVAIPVGITNLTLQTFAAALAGYLLNPAAAALSMAAYLLLGACGLPVFSGFSGGFGMLLGPTGGFLLAFPLMAWLCARPSSASRIKRIASGLAGLLTVYLLGAAGLAFSASISYLQALAVGALPFVWKDVLSVIGAEWIARALQKRGFLS